MKTGLNIISRTQTETNQILNLLDEAGYYVEFDAIENYIYMPEEMENYDQLEESVAVILDGKGVNYRIEGIF